MRLTDDPGDDVNPVWSPDGRTIAFYRSSADGDGIFSSRRSAAQSVNWPESGPTDSDSEAILDSLVAGRRWLAVSDKTSAEEQPLSSINRNRRETSRDVAAGVRRRRLQSGFSPDGKQLAFVRVISAVVGEVYLVSVNGGEPKRLTFNGAGVSNLAWTPNGREIVFASGMAARAACSGFG